jgi:hypothetical protein
MVWFGKIDDLNHYSAVHSHAEQQCDKHTRIRIGLQNLQINELTTAEPVCHSFWIVILPDGGAVIKISYTNWKRGHQPIA